MEYIHSVIIFYRFMTKIKNCHFSEERLPFELKKMVGRDLARCANAKIPASPGIVSGQSSDSRMCARETFGVKAAAAERHHLHVTWPWSSPAGRNASSQAGTPYLRQRGTPGRQSFRFRLVADVIREKKTPAEINKCINLLTRRINHFFLTISAEISSSTKLLLWKTSVRRAKAAGRQGLAWPPS
jgi:hypothetical protein